MVWTRLSVKWLMILAAAAVFAAVAALGAERAAEGRDAPHAIVAASSGEHLWIARPAPPGRSAAAETGLRWDLLHHALDMGPARAAATVPMRERPEAIAAFGDRVWVVFPPAREGAGRSVSTLRVRERVELDMYATEPEGRFALLDMLQSPGRGESSLKSFVGTPAGPFALVRRIVGDAPDVAAADDDVDETSSAEPLPDAEAGPNGIAGTDAGGGERVEYRLLHLRGQSWRSAALPAEGALDQPGSRAMLSIDGPELSRLNLLIADPANPSQALLYRRDLTPAPGTAWSTEPAVIDLDLHRVHSLTHVRGRLAAIMQRETDAAIEIVYIRAGALVPVATLPVPERAAGWAIAGMNDGFRKIIQPDDPAATPTFQSIHWLTGEVGEPAEVRPPSLPAGRLWHVTLMLTIAVVAVLLVLLVRPPALAAAGKGAAGQGGRASAEAGVHLPAGVAVLSPVSRIIALLLDLAPGGVLAVLILRESPIELLRLPIMTHSLDQAAPYLVMIGILFVHVTLSEMLTGSSLGKALVGGRVLSTDGSRPRVTQVLVRNLLKLLILMVPPLAIFALLSQHLQGFNDLLARTVVVGDLPEQEQAPDDDEE